MIPLLPADNSVSKIRPNLSVFLLILRRKTGMSNGLVSLEISRIESSTFTKIREIS